MKINLQHEQHGQKNKHFDIKLSFNITMLEDAYFQESITLVQVTSSFFYNSDSLQK